MTVVNQRQRGLGRREERMERMKRMIWQKLIWNAKIWRDNKGQDLIEYALMAGFVAVAAAAIMPNIFHEHQHDLQQGLQRADRSRRLNVLEWIRRGCAIAGIGTRRRVIF